MKAKIASQKQAMDAHVDGYYEYLEAVAWQEACDAMKAAEGAWEDSGGYGRGGYGRGGY